MLKITLKNWKDYKDELGFDTIPELSKALGVPIRTLESWLYGARNPTEYTKNLINEKLKNIIRINCINQAKETGCKVKEAIKNEDLVYLRTSLIQAMNYKNKTNILNALIQIRDVSDIYLPFLNVLLIDWEDATSDYLNNGTFSGVIETFAMAMI